jgi:hypothetical protein
MMALPEGIADVAVEPVAVDVDVLVDAAGVIAGSGAVVAELEPGVVEEVDSITGPVHVCVCVSGMDAGPNAICGS